MQAKLAVCEAQRLVDVLGNDGKISKDDGLKMTSEFARMHFLSEGSLDKGGRAEFNSFKPCWSDIVILAKNSDAKIIAANPDVADVGELTGITDWEVPAASNLSVTVIRIKAKRLRWLR